ncbi:MAG: S8 family peptidase [Candidatus Spyradosoma sp.]
MTLSDMSPRAKTALVLAVLLLAGTAAALFPRRSGDAGTGEATLADTAERARRAEAPSAETRAPALPAGAIAGETVLFFRDAAALEAFLKNAAARGLKILGVVPALNAVRVSVAPGFDAARIPGAIGADFNFAVRVPATPPDAEARDVSGRLGRVPVGGNALAQLGVSEESRAASSLGAGVKVALLDTGVFAEHASLRNAKISVIDVAGGAADTPDSLAHGTAVASLIAGCGENGVFGMAANAEILAVRVFDGAGNATAFELARGLVAAADAGARVISVSAGLDADSAVLRAAVEYVLRAGATLVAAAGNEGVTALSFPAGYAGVVSVGAVDGANASAPFSNVGENLSVVAPGVAVTAAGTADTDATTAFSGTSAAAPLVAGTLAAALADSAGTLAADALEATADDFGAPGRDAEYGAGLVNFERLTRPAGARVSDVSVNDVYCRRAEGGRAEPAVFVTIQNRGSLWEDCAFSLRIVFADGSVSATGGALRLSPGESVGRGAGVSEAQLREGVLVEAGISDASGAVLSERSLLLRSAD